MNNMPQPDDKNIASTTMTMVEVEVTGSRTNMSNGANTKSNTMTVSAFHPSFPHPRPKDSFDDDDDDDDEDDDDDYDDDDEDDDDDYDDDDDEDDDDDKTASLCDDSDHYHHQKQQQEQLKQQQWPPHQPVNDRFQRCHEQPQSHLKWQWQQYHHLQHQQQLLALRGGGGGQGRHGAHTDTWVAQQQKLSSVTQRFVQSVPASVIHLELEEDEAKLVGRGQGHSLRRNDHGRHGVGITMMTNYENQNRQQVHRQKHSSFQHKTTALASKNDDTAPKSILKPKALTFKDHRHHLHLHPHQTQTIALTSNMPEQIELKWHRQWVTANGNAAQLRPDSGWVPTSTEGLHQGTQKNSSNVIPPEKSQTSRSMPSKTAVNQQNNEPMTSSTLESTKTNENSSSKIAISSSDGAQNEASTEKAGQILGFMKIFESNDPQDLKKTMLGKRNKEQTIDFSPACESTRHQHWTPEEDDLLSLAVALNTSITNSSQPEIDWQNVSCDAFRRIRSRGQCTQRWRLIQPGVNNGDWTAQEDQIVISMVEAGQTWSAIATRLGNRTNDSVRMRYCEHLDPNVNKSSWKKEEDELLFQLQSSLGNKWAEISRHIPGRTANSVKNRFYNQSKAIACREHKKARRD